MITGSKAKKNSHFAKSVGSGKDGTNFEQSKGAESIAEQIPDAETVDRNSAQQLTEYDAEKRPKSRVPLDKPTDGKGSSSHSQSFAATQKSERKNAQSRIHIAFFLALSAILTHWFLT